MQCQSHKNNVMPQVNHSLFREFVNLLRLKHVIIALVAVVCVLQPASAAPVLQQPAAQIYIVQADDTLHRLANKYYRDPLAWPAIYVATNQQAQTDSRFVSIDSPTVLFPGQLLVVPPPEQVDTLLADYSTQPSAPNIQPLTAAWLTDFSSYVNDARQHFGIPGAALAIVRDNQIVLAEGFGVRQLDQLEEVTPETLFSVGSTTKAMNSLFIATLVDEGVLDWDTPVSEIWPNFALADPYAASQLRVRDLLNMGSGVPRADLVWSGADFTAEQTMESLAELPVLAPRGERFEYNNQMVATGGYAAALAAGGQYGNLEQAYADLLQSHLFNPAEMNSATLSIKAVESNPNHATPHDFFLTGDTQPTYFHADSGISPAGGVNADLLDMAHFLQVQLNRGVAPTGQRVVSEANLTETWQPQIEAYTGTSYAMGWFVEEYEGVEFLWHDGDVLGFKSLLVMVPEANVGLVLLSNRAISYGFSNSVRYHFIEQLYGLDADAGEFFWKQWDNFLPALEDIRASLNPTPPAEDVAFYLGEYEAGWRIEQKADGTVWAIRGIYQWQLWADVEPGKFIIGNGFAFLTPLEFTEDETGEVLMRFELATGESGEYRKV